MTNNQFDIINGFANVCIYIIIRKYDFVTQSLFNYVWIWSTLNLFTWYRYKYFTVSSIFHINEWIFDCNCLFCWINTIIIDIYYLCYSWYIGKANNLNQSWIEMFLYKFYMVLLLFELFFNCKIFCINFNIPAMCQIVERSKQFFCI